MAKTVAVLLDDKAYDLIRKAAEGERRSISSLLEYAALRYLTDELTVSGEEMQEILMDKALVASIRRGFVEAEEGTEPLESAAVSARLSPAATPRADGPRAVRESLCRASCTPPGTLRLGTRRVP
jgi:hypothetical protein